MSLALNVKTDDGILQAGFQQLDVSSLVAVLSVWQIQCRIFPGRYPERAAHAAYHWDWVEVAEGATGQVHGLQVPGIGGYVGLLAVDLDGRTGSGLPCLTLAFLAKMPQAFEVISIGGIGTCLVIQAIQLSFEYGMRGRVRIPEALKSVEHKPKENPSALYQSLGFKHTENQPNGVEYDDLEISLESAEVLIERFTNAK